MDKGTIIAICSDWFKETNDNCAYLHLAGNVDLLIDSMPSCFAMHIQVKKQYMVNGEEVNEIVCVPFQAVLYITLTNYSNLDVINAPYPEEDEMIYDIDDLEDINY